MPILFLNLVRNHLLAKQLNAVFIRKAFHKEQYILGDTTQENKYYEFEI